MRHLFLVLVLSLSLLSVTPAIATALPASVTSTDILLNFPESATFRASMNGETEITSVVLEYGNEQLTCAEVIARAYPQFTPGKTVEVQWTWEMRQSGSLPPGAHLWWRWRVTDANGNETISPTQTAIWLDDVHRWQIMNAGEYLRLHWYEGDQDFAIALAEAASQGLEFNAAQSGLMAEAPIDIYIYASTDDLKDAVLYEPSWTGGQAFPDQNIVILGISEYDLAWGRDAIVHEITHVLVGHLTFSCLGDVPTWLNEGLAVYSEGGLDPISQRQFEDAVREDTLLTIRSLSSGFSEVADKAYLSYSQSYSIVKFLIETYGQKEMTDLLLALRDGLSIDEALVQTYGFDVEGLEDAWRSAIGAPVQPDVAQPTAQPTPTFVPTIVPIGGVSAALQVTSTPVPTSSFNDQPTPAPTRSRPPLTLTLILLAMCCAFLVLIGVVVLGFVVRRQNRREGPNE